MKEEDFYFENIIDAVPDNGCLVVESNNIELCRVHVPPINEEYLIHPGSAFLHAGKTKSFEDLYGNRYYISAYSSLNKVRYEINCDDNENIINIDKAKEFFKSITVRFLNYKDDVLPLKFFTIKTSKEEWIAKLVDFFDHKNTDDIFYIEGLTQLYNDVEKDNLVFVVAGGDKGKIKLDYILGLYGVAKVVNAPSYNKDKPYMIGVRFIYFFNKVITRDMFYDYKDLKNIPNIGAMTKGEKNQAISKISIRQAKAIMLASE